MKPKITFSLPAFKLFLPLWCVSLVFLVLYLPWSCASSGDPSSPFVINSAYVEEVPVRLYTTGDTIEIEAAHSRPVIVLNFSKPILTSSVRSADFVLKAIESSSVNTPVAPFSVSATIQSNTISSTIRAVPEVGLDPSKSYCFEVSSRLKSVSGEALSLKSVHTIYFRYKVSYLKPSQPSSLTIANVTKDGLDVSWSQEDNFGMDLSTKTSYEKGTPAFVVQVLVEGVYVTLPIPPMTMVIDEDMKTAVLSGLSPDKTYKFRVGAVNNKPDTSWSAPYEIKTSSAAEAPARGKRISRRTLIDESLEIEWTEPSSPGFKPDGSLSALPRDAYTVSYATQTTGPYSVANISIKQAERTALVTGLTKGQGYYFIVAAKNEENLSSSDTSEAIATSLASTPTKPATHTLVNQLSPSDPSKAEVSFGINPDYTQAANLGKDDNGNEKSLKSLTYQYKKGTNAYSASQDITAGSAQSVKVANLIPNTKYTFKVRVENNGELADSIEFDVTTKSAVSPPATGKSIQKLGAKVDSLFIQWSAPIDFGRKADGTLARRHPTTPYEVMYATSRTGTYGAANMTALDTAKRQVRVGGLSKTSTYYFRVVARNEDNEVSADTSVGFQVDLKTPPVVGVLTASVVKSDSVTLAWTQVAYGKKSDGSSDASAASVSPLYVQVAEVVNNVLGSWQLATTHPTALGATATTAVAIRLKPNSIYQFRLVAKNELNDSTVGASSGNIATQKEGLLSVAYVETNGAVANSKSLTYGSADSSVPPTLNPVGATVVYSLSAKSPTTSVSGGITIGTNGRIRIADTMSAGTYHLTVTATGTGNYSGAKTADYTVTVSAKAQAPQAPFLSIGQVSSNAVTLAWKSIPSYGKAADGTSLASLANTNPLVILISKDGGDYHVRTGVIEPGVNVLNYTVSGLSTGASYRFRLIVKNTNAGGVNFPNVDTSLPTDPVVVSAMTKPTAPVLSASSAAGSTSVDLSWTAVNYGLRANGQASSGASTNPILIQWSPATGTIQYKTLSTTGATGEPVLDRALSATSTNAKVNGLTSGKKYIFRSIVSNDNTPALRDTGLEASVVVGSFAKAPTLPALSVDAVDSTSVTFSWTAVNYGLAPSSTASKSVVASPHSTEPLVMMQSTDGGVSYTASRVATALTSGSRSAKVIELTKGTAYLFRLIAKNANDPSSQPSETKGTPVAVKTRNVLSGLSLSQKAATITLGQTINVVSTVTPSGADVTYAISRIVPGLSFSTSGVWSGTPTEATVGTIKVGITAYGTGNFTGKFSDTVLLRVNPISLPAKALSLSETKATAFVGVEMTPITPALTPSGASSWVTYKITPNLPAGLSLDTLTGKIAGTATASKAATTYTLTATAHGNYSGSASESLSLTVVEGGALKSLTLTSHYVAQRTGNALSNSVASLVPANAASSVAYSIEPSLPSGLTLNTSTGAISGNTQVATDAVYKLKATAKAGSSYSGSVTDTFRLRVRASSLVDVIPSSMSTTTEYAGPLNIGFVPVPANTQFDTYYIDGNGALSVLAREDFGDGDYLPSGGGSTNVSGMVRNVAPSRTYHLVFVSKSNKLDTVRQTIQIEKKPARVSSLEMKDIIFPIGKRLSASPVVKTLYERQMTTGLSYSLSPDASTLPEGLSFNPNTGTISGQTTQVFSGTYTLTVTGSGNYSGTQQTTFKLETTLFGYERSRYVEALNLPTNIALLPPISGHSAPISYVISPSSLPAGLTFNGRTGAVTGTPTQASGVVTYTVKATYLNGSEAVASFVLETRDVSTFPLPNNRNSPYEFTNGSGFRVLARVGKVTSAIPTVDYWGYWGVDEDELAELLSYYDNAKLEFNIYIVDRRAAVFYGESGWKSFSYSGLLVDQMGTAQQKYTYDVQLPNPINRATGALAITDYPISLLPLPNVLASTTGIALRKKP